ncbi:MAG: MBL fold metallo-hydrolase [Desulfobulbaceae bacterium]|nr:MBL fold metallo-hydrolase [Desulfobulbaceae bacterium]
MKVTFLGVGEACDPMYPNTSLLVEPTTGGQGRQLLLDCGFTVPHLYYGLRPMAEGLDAVWISHFHGDHFFGVPLLLLRLWELERRKPLFVLGPAGVEARVRQVLDLAYPNFAAKMHYPVIFREVEPGNHVEVCGYTWQTAIGMHSQRALALRLEDGEHALFYSGDGRPTAATEELAKGCGLGVHEAFRLSGETPGHGSIHGCLEFAARTGLTALALLHIQRQERFLLQSEIETCFAQADPACKVWLPEPGESFTF